MKVTNLFTQADREVFDRIDRDCLAMHVVPPPKTFLKLEVRDGAGELTDVYEDRAHSWVRNFYNAVFVGVTSIGNGFGSTYAAGSLRSKNISGSIGYTGAAYIESTRGSAGQLFGIVVGVGDDVESFEAFALASMINNGSSAGQLVYNADTSATPVYDAPSKKWTGTRSRLFNNNSGGPITIKEVALMYGTSPQVMNARDVLSTPVTVPNAGQLTVTYTFEMTFPA